MRIGNLEGRLVVVRDGKCADVERATQGRFSSDPAEVFGRWDEFVEASRDWLPQSRDWVQLDESRLGPPSPKPRQIFAIGVNYTAHGKETGIDLPSQPIVFTKFSSSLTGPVATVSLPSSTVDWEIELVAIIGREAKDVPAERAWEYVAGLTIGQDLSERSAQMSGTLPQFSLAKSHPGFSPTGPFLVTPDEFADPDHVQLWAAVNGNMVQNGITSDMIFSIPVLIERLSAVCRLMPGDLIFTGTPDGVGMGLTPPVYLHDGDTLVSKVAEIGELRLDFVANGSQH